MARALPIITSVLLTLISIGPAAAACPGPDWDAVGYRDGNEGQPMHWIGRYSRHCAVEGRAFDRDAYLSGRQRGLENFCQPAMAYAAGAAGERYLGACPRELEPAYLDAFVAGARIHSVRRLIEQLDRQVAWYADRLRSPSTDPRRRQVFAEELTRLAERRREFESRLDRYTESFAALEPGRP